MAGKCLNGMRASPRRSRRMSVVETRGIERMWLFVMMTKTIQVGGGALSIKCDIALARRCGSNWPIYGKFNGTPRKAYESCVRRNPGTAGDDSRDLPRLAGLGRRGKHALVGD